MKLHRYVKMTFRPEEVDTFLSVFEESKQKIRAFPGCLSLQLIRNMHFQYLGKCTMFRKLPKQRIICRNLEKNQNIICRKSKSSILPTLGVVRLIQSICLDSKYFEGQKVVLSLS